jgi:PAS domain S-box-containing protein
MESVLYVDDEECLLDICQVFLARVGSINVDIASSAEAGLKLICEKEYDAIISDYEMPMMNGIDFLKTLRSQGNRTPFIIFTGRGREEIAMEAINSGADFYIQKGGEPRSQFAELIHKVKMAVKRRQGERALEASNSILKATLESTADGILVIGSGGTVSTFNQKFLQMWQIPEDTDRIGTEEELLSLIRDQVCDYAAFQKPVEEIRQNPESGSYDIVHCKDGRIFRRYSQVQKIQDQIVGRVWSFRDITGQSKTELELRAAYEQFAVAEDELKRKYSELRESTELICKNEEKYRSYFLAGTSPVLIVDRKSLEILDINAAAAALYQYDRDELLSLPLYNLSAESPQTTDEICSKTSDLLTHLHRKKNQTIFPVELSSALSRIGEQEILIITIRDISRTKQIEDALKLSNTKLNLLLGITRHDILNNLSGLLGYNDLLQTRISDPSSLELLKKQEKTTYAIKKHIDFTREYDQLGARAPQWHRADETASNAYSQITQKLPFRCETGNLEIYADPLLEKVFYNLFDNAFRYGGGISCISISWLQNGKDLMLIIEDDGIGIADNEKELIFQKGYGKNTGLGLFLTREILSITGMTIVETGLSGKGARFEIRIPDSNYRFLKPVTELQEYDNRQSTLSDKCIDTGAGE